MQCTLSSKLVRVCLLRFWPVAMPSILSRSAACAASNHLVQPSSDMSVVDARFALLASQDLDTISLLRAVEYEWCAALA